MTVSVIASTTTDPATSPAAVPTALLAHAHRQAQAGLLTAVAAEHCGAYAAAAAHVERVTAALRAAGDDALADLLTEETRAGAALLVALTSDDTGPAEMANALAAYQARRVDVDGALSFAAQLQVGHR